MAGQTVRFFDASNRCERINVSRGCRVDAGCTALAERLGKDPWAIRLVDPDGNMLMLSYQQIKGTTHEYVVFGQQLHSARNAPSQRMMKAAERLMSEPSLDERVAWRTAMRAAQRGDPQGFQRQVDRLTEMGFDSEDARGALRDSGFDVARAAERLVAGQAAPRRDALAELVAHMMERRQLDGGGGDETLRLVSLWREAARHLEGSE